MTDDARPVLAQINLVVQDMPAMIEFYRQLGLEIAPTLPEWEPHHRTIQMPTGIDMDLDSREFAVAWNSGWLASDTGPVLGFRVASREAVDEIYDDLTRRGSRGQQPPYDAFWGARYAVVTDPDGNTVGLMSPIDPERAAPPPRPPT